MERKVQGLVLVVNRAKPRAQEIGTAFREHACRVGLRVMVTEDYPVTVEALRGADVCCTIGGDGTILGATEAATELGLPIVGINLGKLGFMATYQPEENERLALDLLSGNYRISRRSLLFCRSADGGRRLALNDVVIRTHAPRLVSLQVRAGEEYLNHFRADGLIFATPTGSTAYNLSAGGPIVHPDSPILIVTPICPHTLSNRSIILHERTPLEVSINEQENFCSVSIDGKEWQPAPHLPLRLEVASRQLQLIQPVGSSYFELVRTKLQWS